MPSRFPKGLVKAAIQERKIADKKINLVSVNAVRDGYEAIFTGYGISVSGINVPLDGKLYLINNYNYYARKQGQKGDLILINVTQGNKINAPILFRWSYNTVTEEIIELPII
jgi:hypothetical protein